MFLLRYNYKAVLLVLGLYLTLFYITQFSSAVNFLSWDTLSLIVAVLVFFVAYKFISGTTKRKLTISLLSTVFAVVLSFVFANVAYMSASQKCDKSLDENYKLLVGQGAKIIDVGSKHWNLKEACAVSLLPFPWGKSAHF